MIVPPNNAILLVNPPVAKPSEPPAGIARLAGALKAHEIPFKILDANMEALLDLLDNHLPRGDTWTSRAWKHRTQHLASLRDRDTYRVRDRYVRAVRDLNHLAGATAADGGARAGLADYLDPALSPVRSDHLLLAAEYPERNKFYPWFSRRLPEMLDGVDMVGFSLNYLSQALCTFAMIGYIRSRYRGMQIVLGGGLLTSWMRNPGWRNPFGGLVDVLVAGPGELPLLRLCGVEPEKALQVSPEYEDMPLDSYLSPGRILPYSAASGCYWNRCSFCPEPAEGNEYRPVPVQHALADLRSLVGTLHPVLVHLLDNAVSPAFLRGLIDEPPGVAWYGFARIGGELADLEYCRALRRSGCVMLKLGLESGDQGVLDRLQKGVDVSVASIVLENLRQAGIGVYLYLLFGTPPETEAEARRTLDFVARHRSSISFLNLALFNMPVGHEAEGLATQPFYEGDLSLYTAFKHPRGWDRDAVRKFLRKEFSRHPAVAEILRNDPPIFTSNHAPFFVGGCGRADGIGS